MTFTLNADAEATYQQNGYYIARSLFTKDEARALRDEGHAIIDRLRERHDVRGTWQTVDDGKGIGTQADQAVLHHCHDMQLHSALFTRKLTDERLGQAFATLMGTDNVQLHHNKFFIKAPRRGAPFPLHQDWPFFPHRDETPMAAIVHLDEASEAKGCVHVVPGSHTRGRLAHVGDKQFYLPDGTVDMASTVALPAAAGDVLFFSYLMVHGSGVNTSDEARSTWLIQVRDPADAPTEDRHRSPGQGTMLRGMNAVSPPPPTSL